MPLVMEILTPEHAKIGVWKIDEPAAYFLDHMTLSGNEQRVMATLPPSKRLEWLASRFMLDHLIDHDQRIETSTLPSGKPVLVGRPEQISLSHSEDYVAAMSSYAAPGVDIQRCKEKILHLENKFANAQESSRIDRSNAVLHLHLLWSAKEALYKIYARKQLSFITHLFVDLPEHVMESGTFTGSVRAPDDTISCVLHYRVLQDYVLVYGQKV